MCVYVSRVVNSLTCQKREGGVCFSKIVVFYSTQATDPNSEKKDRATDPRPARPERSTLNERSEVSVFKNSQEMLSSE